MDATDECHWAHLPAKGDDRALDGVWMLHRGNQVFVSNASSQAATVQIDAKPVEIVANSIYDNTTPH